MNRIPQKIIGNKISLQLKLLFTYLRARRIKYATARTVNAPLYLYIYFFFLE